MKYIRSCENCSKEVRFPLDKGTLLVKCPYCSFTFRVDPDDPSLYQSGRFDVTNSTKTFQTIITQEPNLWTRAKSFIFRNSPEGEINQNLKIFIGIFLIILFILNVWKIMSSSSPPIPHQREERIQLEEGEPTNEEKTPYQI